MKPAKWLALLLVLFTGALILLRHKTEDAVTPGPGSMSPDVAMEKDSANSAASAAEAATVTTLAPFADAQPQKAQDELATANHLQVIVQDEVGQPLAEASVRTSFRGEQRRPALTNLSRTFTTSSHGIADVLWPTQKFEQLELLVSKDDYASRKMLWDLKTGDAIPSSYIVKLKGAVHIGGFVVDPEGNPIAEASVSLSRFWSGGENIQSKGEEAAFPTQKHATGTNGHWTARNLPPELLERISITADHTNFIGVRVTMDRKPEIEQELREGKYRIQLKRGLEVRGRVINEQQERIAGAQVWAGRKNSRERQQTKTDTQGRFAFRNINEGKVDFSAMADGYAPDTKAHNVRAASEEIVFQLAQGSVIRGTVQDESSQPIEGVRVVLEGSPGDVSYDRFEFSATTDSEGKFEWKSAPNSPMPFYFGKTGYEQRRSVRLKPAEDNVVTLRHNRQVQGQVLDAETDQPVTRFSVTTGRYSGPNQFFRSSSRDTTEFNSEQGLFTLDIHEEEQNGIQVAAKDYAEKAQALPPPGDGQINVVVKLKSSKALQGIVVTPEGQPVPGVSVALVDGNPGGRSIQFGRGQLRGTGSRSTLVITDASGHFEIPSPPEAGTVVAANGSAYGSASIAEIKASGLLVLQGFGRIEGVLTRGGAGVAGQELLLTSPNSGVSFEFESTMQTTDAEGRFAFEKVPAGTNSIVRLVRTSARSRASSHRTAVIVVPGETTPVVLGGTDATLQAQVKFETAPSEAGYIISAQLSTMTPQLPPGLSPEQRREFMNTPEWKEHIRNMKYYSATVAGDGSLIVDSVAPGQYTLRVTAQKADDESFGAKPIAQGTTTFTIPSGADPATPLHVGEVLLKPAK